MNFFTAMRLDFPYHRWIAISLVAFAFVIFGNMLPPVDWVSTHYLFNYDLGFQKRGLFGEIRRFFQGGELTTLQARKIAASLTLISSITLFWFLTRRFRASSAGGPLLLLFVTSTAFATFVGNTGLLDMVLVLGCIAALSLPYSVSGHVGRVALLAVMPLFHENFLPFFAVLIAFDVWIRDLALPMSRRVLLPASFMLVAVASVVIVFEFGRHPYEDIWWVGFDLRCRAVDFFINRPSVEAISQYPEGVRKPFDVIWTKPRYFFRLFAYGSIGLLFIALYLHRLLKSARHLDRLTRLGMIMVCLAPVSLNFVAFDVSRFMAIGLLCVFLLAASLIRHDARFSEALASAVTPSFVITMLVISSYFQFIPINDVIDGTDGFPGNLIDQADWFILPEPTEYWWRY